MRILAIDVGEGTQDVLLYDDSVAPENSIKLVLPAMTRVLARRILSSKKNLLFYGETMGGGPLALAIAKHIERGYKIVMTENSARSIRDNLEQVEEMGVEIISDSEIDKYNYERIETRDIDFQILERVFSAAGESFSFDCIAIAVQDHGHVQGREISDRIFRFEKFREALERDDRLSSLAYTSPPKYFTRMNAALRTARKFYKGKIVVADTKIAAIAGALHGVKERPAICIDAGNGHTMAALVEKAGKLSGIFEHHTHMLTRKRLENLLIRFAEGELTNKEVFSGGGHGCCIRKKVGMKNVKKIMVTGPNRELLKNSKLEVEFSIPLGDAMMAGPIGLVDIINETSNPQPVCRRRHLNT
jgi:uncharacterized protein (DUF1786 family)